MAAPDFTARRRTQRPRVWLASSAAPTKSGCSTATARSIRAVTACRSSRRSASITISSRSAGRSSSRSSVARLPRRQHAVRARVPRVRRRTRSPASQPARSAAPFWRAFFFSVETLATIGYGNISPNGLPRALRDDRRVARRPAVVRARHGNSVRALLAADRRGDVQLARRRRAVPRASRRSCSAITNARTNQLVELEAKVLFSHIEGSARKYYQLTLERTRVVVLSAELDDRASDRREESDVRDDPRRLSSRETPSS